MNTPLSISWWRYAALMTLWTAAYGVCVEPALFGHQHWTLGGPVGALVGVLGAARYRDSAYWRLPPGDRRRVVLARRTGIPTWDPALDLVVREQLRSAAGQARSRWPVAVVLTAFVVGLPVLAAVRTGTAWYALAAVALIPPALLTVRAAALEDPRRRLARLETAMAVGPPVEGGTEGEVDGAVRPAGTGR